MRTLFLITTITAKAVIAQPPEKAVWLAAQLPVTLTEKWQWHNDAGYRTLGIRSAPYQFLYRTGIRYRLNAEINFAAGTALFFTRTSYQKFNHEFGKEFRLWQEISTNHLLLTGFSIQNRLRTEQRWFAGTTNAAGYFATRYRYRGAVSKALSKKLTVQIADEYMMQHAEQKFSFNQNRLMLSALYNLNDQSQLQLGYMWLKWVSASQHIITFSFQKIFASNGNNINTSK